MKDWKTFVKEMFIPGTTSCMIFGAVLGLIFAVLCLTIGVAKALLIGVFCLIGGFFGKVKDKKAFIRNLVNFFHNDHTDRYE